MLAVAPRGRLYADRLRLVEAPIGAELYGYHLAEHDSDAARQRRLARASFSAYR
jgi:hypothetical protein